MQGRTGTGVRSRSLLGKGKGDVEPGLTSEARVDDRGRKPTGRNDETLCDAS